MNDIYTAVKESLYLGRDAVNVVRAGKYESVAGNEFRFYFFIVVFDVAITGFMTDIATDSRQIL